MIRHFRRATGGCLVAVAVTWVPGSSCPLRAPSSRRAQVLKVDQVVTWSTALGAAAQRCSYCSAIDLSCGPSPFRLVAPDERWSYGTRSSRYPGGMARRVRPAGWTGPATSGLPVLPRRAGCSVVGLGGVLDELAQVGGPDLATLSDVGSWQRDRRAACSVIFLPAGSTALPVGGGTRSTRCRGGTSPSRSDPSVGRVRA